MSARAPLSVNSSRNEEEEEAEEAGGEETGCVGAEIERIIASSAGLSKLFEALRLRANGKGWSGSVVVVRALEKSESAA